MHTPKEAPKNCLLIIEKYERFTAYLYPIIQRTPRAHGIVRDKFLTAMFEQVGLFMQAGKSGSISKLYAADANLAMLRYYMRFYKEVLHHITPKQETYAQTLLHEVGSILGSWIKTTKGK